MLKADGSQAIIEWPHSHLSLRWIIMTCIRISQILVNCEYCSKASDSIFDMERIDLKFIWFMMWPCALLTKKIDRILEFTGHGTVTKINISNQIRQGIVSLLNPQTIIYVSRYYPKREFIRKFVNTNKIWISKSLRYTRMMDVPVSVKTLRSAEIACCKTAAGSLPRPSCTVTSCLEARSKKLKLEARRKLTMLHCQFVDQHPTVTWERFCGVAYSLKDVSGFKGASSRRLFIWYKFKYRCNSAGLNGNGASSSYL